jgi:hypothetical protein
MSDIHMVHSHFTGFRFTQTKRLPYTRVLHRRLYARRRGSGLIFYLSFALFLLRFRAWSGFSCGFIERILRAALLRGGVLRLGLILLRSYYVRKYTVYGRIYRYNLRFLPDFGGCFKRTRESSDSASLSPSLSSLSPVTSINIRFL